MKKSLANFASSKPKTQTPPQQNIETTKAPSQAPNHAQNLQKQIEEFQSMPRENLLKTFYQEVEKQKQNGTFDIQKLENTLSSLDAFLTPEQKKNIKELLNQI